MSDYMSMRDFLKLMWRAGFGTGEDTAKFTQEEIERFEQEERDGEVSEATRKRRARDAQEQLRRQRQKEAAAWRRRLDVLRDGLLGDVLETRHDWIRSIRPILLEIDSKRKVEGLVIVALSSGNRVVYARIITGTATSVSFSVTRLVEDAKSHCASKVVLGHNHPSYSSASPSDNDVESAASVYFALRREGLSLADDLVVCRTSKGMELKSALATHRFKSMVREY